jgi:phosphatidylinositol glycan class M
MLNKVSTSQYFMWYLGLLPLVVAESSLSVRNYVILAGLWVSGQALWLSQAYRLEFLGEHVFFNLWVASIVFYVVQVGIICAFISGSRK